MSDQSDSALKRPTIVAAEEDARARALVRRVNDALDQEAAEPAPARRREQSARRVLIIAAILLGVVLMLVLVATVFVRMGTWIDG